MDLIDDLLNDTDHSEDFSIPDNEMCEYLRHVTKTDVTMDPEADRMLKQYFEATRVIRQGKKQSLNCFLLITLAVAARFCYTEVF